MKLNGLIWAVFTAGIITFPSCERVSLLCSHQVLATATAPARGIVAEAIREDCGAASAATTVSVRKTGWPSAQREVFQIASWNTVRLAWSDGHTLVVQCADCDGELISRQERDWRDVKIRYELAGREK